MASRTIYTSTITVPVYASWKCQKCGELNFSAGAISHQVQASTASFRSSKHAEAKSTASNLAQAGWAEHAFKIIKDPRNNAEAMRQSFFLQNTNCTKCGAKPKWDKDSKYMAWFGFAFVFAILSGLMAFAMKTNIIAWLIFGGLLAVIIYCIMSEENYKKTLKSLPEQYMPVIGSINPELIEYADHLGQSIPTPDESFQTVKGYGHLEDTQSDFCRKCGTKLPAGSSFCHRCGEKVVKGD